MTTRGLVFFCAGALTQCSPVAAQSERHIALEATAVGVVIRVEPSADGEVLLSSAGRILGQRADQWSGRVERRRPPAWGLYRSNVLSRSQVRTARLSAYVGRCQRLS